MELCLGFTSYSLPLPLELPSILSHPERDGESREGGWMLTVSGSFLPTYSNDYHSPSLSLSPKTAALGDMWPQ